MTALKTIFSFIKMHSLFNGIDDLYINISLIRSLLFEGLLCLCDLIPNTIQHVSNLNTALMMVSTVSSDEKDMMDYFAYLFSLVDIHLFQDIIEDLNDFLFNVLISNISLLAIPQYFLALNNLSKPFGHSLLSFLMLKLPLVGEAENITSLVILRLFKLLFLSVSVYPEENEAFLLPELSELIIACLNLKEISNCPFNFYLLLRSLFRSIGGGRFESLYKEVHILLPTILEKFSSAFYDQNISLMHKEIVVELCLTTPVRLSVLLPHLHLLMAPLVFSLGSTSELKTQGMRTLELCIDNLLQEYLDPIIENVCDDIVQLLFAIVKNEKSSSSQINSSLRILGKLGSRARRFRPLLEQSENFYSNNFNLVLYNNNDDKILIPFGTILKHVLCNTNCCDGVTLLALQTFNICLPEMIKNYETFVHFNVYIKLYISLCVSKKSEFLLDSSKIIFDSFIQSNFLNIKLDFVFDFFIFCIDAICEKPRRVFESFFEGFLTIFNEFAVKIGGWNVICELPFVYVLADRLIALSYSENFVKCFNSVVGISLILKFSFEPSWMWLHETRFLKSFVFALKYFYSKDFDLEIEYTKCLIFQTIQKAAILDKNSRTKTSRQYFSNMLKSFLVSEVTTCNICVAQTIQECLIMYSNIVSCSISDLLFPFKERLISPIFSKPLRALPLSLQIGYINAVDFYFNLNLNQPLLTVNDDIVKFLQESINLADIDDTFKKASQFEKTTLKIYLKVVCLKFLASALTFSEFQNSRYSSTKNQIIALLFKALYSPNVDIVNISRIGLEKLILNQHKLPKDLMQSGLRPVLTNLTDPKKITPSNVKGLCRLLGLLTSYFKPEIGRKMLEHILSWSEAPNFKKDINGLFSENLETNIIDGLFSVFPLLPIPANIFIPDVIKQLLLIEKNIKRKRYNLFRKHVCKFVSRSPSITIELFWQNVSDPSFLEIFLHFIVMPEGKNLVYELANHIENFISQFKTCNSSFLLLKIFESVLCQVNDGFPVSSCGSLMSYLNEIKVPKDCYNIFEEMANNLIHKILIHLIRLSSESTSCNSSFIRALYISKNRKGLRQITFRLLPIIKHLKFEMRMSLISTLVQEILKNDKLFFQDSINLLIEPIIFDPALSNENCLKLCEHFYSLSNDFLQNQLKSCDSSSFEECRFLFKLFEQLSENEFTQSLHTFFKSKFSFMSFFICFSEKTIAQLDFDDFGFLLKFLIINFSIESKHFFTRAIETLLYLQKNLSWKILVFRNLLRSMISPSSHYVPGVSLLLYTINSNSYLHSDHVINEFCINYFDRALVSICITFETGLPLNLFSNLFSLHKTDFSSHVKLFSYGLKLILTVLENVRDIKSIYFNCLSILQMFSFLPFKLNSCSILSNFTKIWTQPDVSDELNVINILADILSITVRHFNQEYLTYFFTEIQPMINVLLVFLNPSKLSLWDDIFRPFYVHEIVQKWILVKVEMFLTNYLQNIHSLLLLLPYILKNETSIFVFNHVTLFLKDFLRFDNNQCFFLPIVFECQGNSLNVMSFLYTFFSRVNNLKTLFCKCESFLSIIPLCFKCLTCENIEDRILDEIFSLLNFIIEEDICINELMDCISTSCHLIDNNFSKINDVHQLIIIAYSKYKYCHHKLDRAITYFLSKEPSCILNSFVKNNVNSDFFSVFNYMINGRKWDSTSNIIWVKIWPYLVCRDSTAIFFGSNKLEVDMNSLLQILNCSEKCVVECFSFSLMNYLKLCTTAQTGMLLNSMMDLLKSVANNCTSEAFSSTISYILTPFLITNSFAWIDLSKISFLMNNSRLIYNLIIACEKGIFDNADVDLALASLYKYLGEETLLFSTHKRLFKSKETVSICSLMQANLYYEAQNIIESCFDDSKSTKITAITSKELVFISEKWVECAQKLQQWDLIQNYYQNSSDSFSWLQAKWHNNSIEMENTDIYNALSYNSSDLSTLFQIRLLSIITNHEQKSTTKFQETIHKWSEHLIDNFKKSPSVLSDFHAKLFGESQIFVESQETYAVFSNVLSANNISSPSFLQEIKGIFGTWRDRLPNTWEDIMFWKRIYTWRYNVFSFLNHSFTCFPDILATHPYASRGYHEIAWIINRFAKTARLHGLKSTSLAYLNRIYTLPNIEVPEAFYKLNEQAKCYMDDPTDLSIALDVINSTNIGFFQTIQKADFFALKADLMAKLGLVDEANRVFAQAVQIDLNLAKGWSLWGSLNDQRFRQTKESIYASNAINCFLQAATLLKPSRARKYLTRLLWILSFESPNNDLSSSFELYNNDLPVWFWIPLVYFLIFSLDRSESSICRLVLVKILRTYPQVFDITVNLVCVLFIKKLL